MQQWPVSPDGNWIAMTPGVDNRSIWIERLDGTQRRLVTRKICCLVWHVRGASAAVAAPAVQCDESDPAWFLT